MKTSEICSLAINIVAGNYGNTTYRMGNTSDVSWPYNNMTWFQNAWRSDCLGFVRACLCGWNGDKTVNCGGADYTYPCYNLDTWGMLDYGCSSSSRNFALLMNNPCSLVKKDSPYGHVGLFVGEFQLEGKTYNVCECTSWYGADNINGCKPTWVDTDGTRRFCKGGEVLGSAWLEWGTFENTGYYFPTREYDGGATGATGFGSELTEDEVNYYYDEVYQADWLTYEYLEALAYSLYGMDSRFFQAYVGYVSGENPWWFDNYMLYLDSCICVNRYMGNNATTPELLSPYLAGGDTSGYYDASRLLARGQDCHDQPNTLMAQRTYAGIMLAMSNPNQKCIGCHGMPPKPPIEDIIYIQYDVQTWSTPDPEIWAFTDATAHDYDITGSGIRGGIPDPYYGKRRMPMFLYLRCPQLYPRKIVRRF